MKAGEGGAGHVLPKRIYFAVFASLIALTGLTVAIAFLNLGPLNNVAALTIAVIKATLVVLFFMHVRYSGRLISVVAIAGFFWLLIMFALTLSDYLTRDWLTISWTVRAGR